MQQIQNDLKLETHNDQLQKTSNSCKIKMELKEIKPTYFSRTIRRLLQNIIDPKNKETKERSVDDRNPIHHCI